jgi:hypothetical protein
MSYRPLVAGRDVPVKKILRRGGSQPLPERNQEAPDESNLLTGQVFFRPRRLAMNLQADWQDCLDFSLTGPS